MVFVSTIATLALLSTVVKDVPDYSVLVDGIRLWGEVRYRHPKVALGAVDWDAALVEAVPQLLTASTQADEAHALSTMLAWLEIQKLTFRQAQVLGSALRRSRPAGSPPTFSCFRYDL